MSFWQKAVQAAKDIGTSAASAVNVKANEVRLLKEKYESMSDEELVRIANSDGVFGHTSTEKGVAFSTLKARGYTAEDLRARRG